MKGGGQQQNASPETTFFFLVLMLILMLLMAWYYHHETIVRFFFTIRSYEVSFLYYLFDPIYDLISLIDIDIPDPVYYKELSQSLFTMDFETVTLAQFREYMAVSGQGYVYPGVVLALAYSIYLMFFKNKTSNQIAWMRKHLGITRKKTK